MPIYEYECTGCGHRFELRQGFNDQPVESCPLCQGRSRRVIHSVPIVFKGSGFYVNDYRKDGGRDYDGDKTDPKTQSKVEPKAETKTETKTEAKPETKPASKTDGKEASGSKSQARA